MSGVSDAASKPRVLLSILKSACLEHLGDSETLFTAITAGFGRFESDRLLKPSGVELMNLPQSANIEISVLRKDRTSGQKQLLFHGLVPLAAVNPFFLQNKSSAEPQVWENWLGLFNADVSLKDQSPDKLFQRCLEMGTSNARFPRLLLRMQYLHAASPGTSVARGGTPSNTNQVTKSMVGTVNGTGIGTSGPSGFNSVVHSDAAPPPCSTLQSPPPGSSQHLQSPPPGSRLGGNQMIPPGTGSGIALGSSTGSPVRPMTGGYPARRPSKDFSDAGRQPAAPDPVPALPGRSDMATGHGVDWRQQYDLMAQQMAQSQAMWDERRKFLESSLQDAEKTAYHKAERGEDDTLSRGPHKLASYVKQCVELQRQVFEMQRRAQQLEQERATLEERDVQREAELQELSRGLIEKAGPALERLGRPLRSDDAEAYLQESVSALSEAADARCSEVLLEALPRALRGEEALEAYLGQLDPLRREGFEGTGALLACRQAARSMDAQRGRMDSSVLKGSFYVPVKSDPVDCLLASQLLRLQGSPPNFARLRPGVYRFGPHGLRLRCAIDQGILKVQVAEEGDAASGDPMELGTFLSEQGVAAVS